MRERERNSTLFRNGAITALGALASTALVYALYLLRHVALIFALAVFWAYFLAWPARWLTRWMPYKRAITIVFTLSFVVILGTLGPIGTMLYHQTNELVQKLPSMASQLEQTVSNLQVDLGSGAQPLHLDESLTSMIEQLRQNAPALLSKAFNASQTFLTGTAEILAALIVIPLISFYLLLDTIKLRSSLIGLFPVKWRGDVQQVLSAVNTSLGTYIYSRVILALFAGVLMLFLLLSLRIPFSLVLSLLAFIGEFIPVIGAWIVIVPTCLIALATNPDMILWVVVGFGAIQLIQNYVIAPRLMSETMDIHPLTVVAAMLVGGSIGGFAGLLLAIPAAAALKVVFNMFVLRRAEKGVHVPALDLIGAGGDGGAVDFREAIIMPSLEPMEPDEPVEPEANGDSVDDEGPPPSYPDGT